MGVPGTGFRSLNGSAIATRSRSNGFGSVSTSGISVRGYGTQYRSETRKGCSIAKTETASSQHRLWITPIIIRASRYGVGWIIGPGDGSPVKGRGRDAIGAIGTALVIIGRYAFLLAGVFLYCCWYRLLDMLLLLLMLMDYLLDRTQKRLDLIGLASGGGSNEHSTASSQQRWMPHLYISSFSLLNKGGDGL